MGNILGNKEEKKEIEKEPEKIEEPQKQEEKKEEQIEEPENKIEPENTENQDKELNNEQIYEQRKGEKVEDIQKEQISQEDKYIYLSKKNKSDYDTYVFKSQQGTNLVPNEQKRSLIQEEKDDQGIQEEIQDEFKEPRNTELEENKNYEPKDSERSYDNIKIMSIKKKEKKGTGLIDIPRHEYEKYDGKEVIIVGDGMDTGEYKFIGDKTYVRESQNKVGTIPLTEEEIQKEINMRYTKAKEKKLKYEIVDKFFAVTEFGGKTIKKVSKEENKSFYSNLGNYENIVNNNKMSNEEIINNYNRTSNYQYIHEIPIQTKSNYFSKINYNEYNKDSMHRPMPLDNYSLFMLNQINQIRKNPQSFIEVIENAKKKIGHDRKGRLIYNGKIKIALTKGEPAFDDVIKILKETQSMEPLEFCNYITAEAPRNDVEIKDINDLTKKVEYMINKGGNICSYWRDVVNDPEISFLLMIVDDNGVKSGMRRKDLLNPRMKYIGISSSEINKNFVCYITLSS